VLIDKAEKVAFDLVDGRKIDAPFRAGMLHDPDGKVWPACSLLVMSYRRGTKAATKEQFNGDPKNYFGRHYEASVSMISLPPKAISEWKFVGDVKRVLYVRVGTKAPGGYHHDINKPRGLMRIVFLFKGKGEALLFRRGRTYRLDLQPCSKAMIDDRGLVWP
jgi:hypothetical protein